MDDTLVEVWREVGRNLELSRSLQTIADSLGRLLPLRGMVVTRLDASASAVVVVARAGTTD